MMGDLLAYWTKVVPETLSSFALLFRPIHLAGIEIVIAFDNADLGSEHAELGLRLNLTCDLRVIFMDGVR